MHARVGVVPCIASNTRTSVRGSTLDKDKTVSIDRIVNLLAAVTLFEMMVTIGLGVKVADIAGLARDRRTVARALVANYLLVPAAAVGLLLLFHAAPLVGAAFLIAAVCPGAPYSPPFTGIAKGNVPLAVGLMLVLAGSSAVAAPLLLRLLLPLVSGDQQLEIDTAKMVETLLEDQLLPLCAGLFLRHRLPVFADRLVRPARALSLILNVALLVTILTDQFGLLAAIPPRAFGGMFLLVLAALAAGWLLGGPGHADRTAMVMAASVRNVAVSLVIAMSSFPGTPAILATTVFGLFQTIAMALIALGWGRLARSRLEHDPEK
nr:bile acid:sodium symporter [Bradyrhizobium diazoefficiens]